MNMIFMGSDQIHLPAARNIQYNLKLAEDLHRRLKVRAALEGRSMGEIIVEALTSYLNSNEGV